MPPSSLKTPTFPVSDSFGMTDVGLVRSANEDSVWYDPEIELFIVADGMGGHAAGEEASRICIEEVSKHYREFLDGRDLQNCWREPDFLSSVQEALGTAIALANDAIYQCAQDNPEWEGMGTTVVAAAGCGEHVVIGHIGDSRVYRFDGKKWEPVTRDHSLLNHCLEIGWITKDQARFFPYKHIVLKAMGLNPGLEGEITITEKRAGDLFLLCSDGLSDLVNDFELNRTTHKTGTKDLEQLAAAFTDRALCGGGFDNITVLMFRIGDEG